MAARCIIQLNKYCVLPVRNVGGYFKCQMFCIWKWKSMSVIHFLRFLPHEHKEEDSNPGRVIFQMAHSAFLSIKEWSRSYTRGVTTGLNPNWQIYLHSADVWHGVMKMEFMRRPTLHHSVTSYFWWSMQNLWHWASLPSGALIWHVMPANPAGQEQRKPLKADKEEKHVPSWRQGCDSHVMAACGGKINIFQIMKNNVLLCFIFVVMYPTYLLSPQFIMILSSIFCLLLPW